MKKQELGTWLLQNAGPIIRYRTATEILPQTKSLDIRRLDDEMLQSLQVQLWLKRFIPPRLLNNSPITGTVLTSGLLDIHTTKPTGLENALAKLADFGLRAGMSELDNKTLPYRKWLEENAERPTANVLTKPGWE